MRFVPIRLALCFVLILSLSSCALLHPAPTKPLVYEENTLRILVPTNSRPLDVNMYIVSHDYTIELMYITEDVNVLEALEDYDADLAIVSPRKAVEMHQEVFEMQIIASLFDGTSGSAEEMYCLVAHNRMAIEREGEFRRYLEGYDAAMQLYPVEGDRILVDVDLVTKMDAVLEAEHEANPFPTKPVPDTTLYYLL